MKNLISAIAYSYLATAFVKGSFNFNDWSEGTSFFLLFVILFVWYLILLVEHSKQEKR